MANGIKIPELPTVDEAKAVLETNKDKFDVDGVKKIYVGWLFRDAWITAERAIVVLAAKAKTEDVTKAVPAKLGQFQVQVRADPNEKIKTKSSLLDFTAIVPDELYQEPEFPTEIKFRSIDPNEFLATGKATKPTIQYDMPQNINLKPPAVQMDLILHVSPEQGFAQLKPFLENAGSDLIVGMYDFTAPHIEQALLSGLGTDSRLTMTLDSPGQPHKREQTVETTRDELQNDLGNRLNFAWALSGRGKESPATAFSTAYHIKLAVTGNKFWLSSGNWNTSNQPKIDPNNTQNLKAIAKTHDRDWHVICKSETHANLFRAYLEKDYQTASEAASQLVAVEGPSAPWVDSELQDTAINASTPDQFFPPLILTNEKVELHALFTPYQYREPIIDLINGANHSFYMQTQYIHPTGPRGEKLAPLEKHKHEEILAALVDATQRGVDVKVITSEYQDFGWIERLQDTGFYAVELLKIQPHVHNKGIVVDGRTVVISSQNWSPDGTGPNRDAGVVIYSQKAAAYFETIFLHDWNMMAAHRVYRN